MQSLLYLLKHRDLLGQNFNTTYCTNLASKRQYVVGDFSSAVCGFWPLLDITNGDRSSFLDWSPHYYLFKIAHTILI